VLLASAPALRRSRAWLQDKLWSDRGPEQGAASMRQALVDIRRAWGEARDCLLADAGWIGLDPARVAIEVDPRPEDLGLSGALPEFAEGLDVRDPEFEDWIRDQRRAYADRLAACPPAVAPEGPSSPAGVAPAGATPGPAARVSRPGSRLPTTAVAGALLLLLSIGAAVLWVPPGPRMPEASAVPLAASATPSVAVLPFDSLGGDAAQQALVHGITRDIVTDLSKFGSLFVVRADTDLGLANIAAPEDGAAPEAIVVRYAVTGSVQWLADQVRVNAQVIETESGRHVWAERFDRPADDLLKLQNEISRRVVDIIGPVSAGQGKLRQAELDRLARVPTENLQAYDLYLQGVMAFERSTPADNLLARDAFARAAALDPGYARAPAMAAWTYLNDVWTGRAETPGAALAQAEALAERALEADPGEAYAYWALGAVRLFQRRHDQAIAAYRRALELNPNGADLLVYLGWALTYAGKPDEGLAYMRQAIERNPYHPGWYLWDLGWGHFVAGRYQEAADTLERRSPRTVGTRMVLALAYAKLGRHAEAAREMEMVLAARPYLTVEHAAALEPFAREEDRQHYVEALRAADVPSDPR
jgi:adenylate cyclase